ncbi:uncharacterized protein RSE6_14639 [Rhynchosporium secalis]|uniref:Uncharacterized protein n=1 Tax=Rhynchosporium secalis TaxID=38038 RepID=A0A1E1MVR7_RHYSE|nr:uncharacterized protein RSE6_14639 [Rhynchosporium secalis]
MSSKRAQNSLVAPMRIQDCQAEALSTQWDDLLKSKPKSTHLPSPKDSTSITHLLARKERESRGRKTLSRGTDARPVPTGSVPIIPSAESGLSVAMGAPLFLVKHLTFSAESTYWHIHISRLVPFDGEAMQKRVPETKRRQKSSAEKELAENKKEEKQYTHEVLICGLGGEVGKLEFLAKFTTRIEIITKFLLKS